MDLTSELERRRRRRSTVLAVSVGASLALAAVAAPAAQAYGPYELTGVGGSILQADGTTPANQAGATPGSLNLDFGIPDNIQDALPTPDEIVLPVRNTWLEPRAVTDEVRVDLPAGLTADPTAFPTCTNEQLEAYDGTNQGPSTEPHENQCPDGSQVGIVNLEARGEMILGWGRSTFWVQVPVYNMTRSPGQVGRFAFNPESAPASVVVEADFSRVDVIGKVRPEDNGISFTLKAPQSLPMLDAKMEIWGTPGAASHDADRRKADVILATDNGYLGSAEEPLHFGAYYEGVWPVEDRTTPFLTNPTSCDGPLMARVTVRSVDGETDSRETQISDGMQGCGKLPFAPEVSFGSDGPVRADSAVALKVGLKVPQADRGDVLASAHVEDVKVTLPEGFSINPSVANGLDTCTDEQFAQGTDDPVACPDAAQVGTVAIDSPLVDSPLEGKIFVGQPKPGNRYRLLLLAEGHGVSIRLNGDVQADPVTGRLTTTFEGNPELPFSDLDLQFNGGERGIIAAPQTCGTAEGEAAIKSYASRSRVITSAPIEVVGCDGFPFSPGFSASTVSLRSGAFSPLSVGFTRADGNQFLSGISATLPLGMTAKLKGVQRCAEAQVAAESCPGGSQIGSVSVKAGTGGAPYGLSGPVYLTNGYKGGSFGMVAIVRAVAGPYDLGNVVVRQALRIDPETAQVTVDSDPLPQIKEGIPLRLRDLTMHVSRAGFLRNPTSCGAGLLGATVRSAGGAAATPSTRLSFDGCKDLKFGPKIKLALGNKTQMGKGKHPRLTATVTQAEGEAGFASTSVTLPKALALAADNAQALCETAAALADKCPPSSIVGSAKAETPILDKALSGPVYFVKGERKDPKTGNVIKTLPTLYVALRGETTINLRATTSVRRNELVTTFPAIPDQPITKFTLNIDGGQHGIIAATRSLCGAKLAGSVRFAGQNGAKPAAAKPAIGTACGAKRSSKK